MAIDSFGKPQEHVRPLRRRHVCNAGGQPNLIAISFCLEGIIGRKGLSRAGAARRYPTSKVSQNIVDQALSISVGSSDPPSGIPLSPGIDSQILSRTPLPGQ